MEFDFDKLLKAVYEIGDKLDKTNRLLNDIESELSSISRDAGTIGLYSMDLSDIKNRVQEISEKL